MLQTPASFVPLLTARDAPDRLTFIFHRDRLLLREADLAPPDGAAVSQLVAAGLVLGPAHPVGEWDGRYIEVAGAAGGVDGDAPPVPPGYAFHGLRSLLGNVDDGFAGLAGRAWQIAEWARTHQYCGVCATPMLVLAGERCFKCPNCGMTAYPRISPAMMVLVRKGDSVLLAWHTAAAVQRFTPLAGFLEAGESAEEAVHREVMEEVGLRVHNLRYFGSQSWPFPHSLMIAYTADYLDGEICVDQNEIAEARWFGPDDDWPEMLSTISIASALMAANRPVRRGGGPAGQ